MLLENYLKFFLAFLWGILWGSFGSTLIYRAINGISIFNPPFSFCPNCKNRIKWFQNIPILSYILLGGKCAFCKAKIDITYFISELLSGVLCVFCVLISDSLLEFISNFFFLWGLLIASISDIKFLLIPTLSVIFSSFGSILHTILYGNFKDSISGAIFGVGILLFTKIGYKIIRKREGLGEGDVIFMIPIGLYFGFFKTLTTLIFSSFLGGILGLALMSKMRTKEIPFVPFLLISVLTVIVLESNFPNFWFLFQMNI